MRLPGIKKRKSRRGSSIPFERRLLVLILSSGLFAVVLSMALLWLGRYSLVHKIELTGFAFILWIGLSFKARNTVINSIRVLSNVISSVREEDFSFRAARASTGDALGELAMEINHLAGALKTERMGAVDAEKLLRKVLSEVDDVILAFAPDGRLKLSNRAASGFLGKAQAEIADKTAEELGISNLLEGNSPPVVSRSMGGLDQRWILKRRKFRQGGVPHSLLMISEASEALRAEERQAWQRLVRVLSHEINNSLAPIKSITRTLGKITSNLEMPERLRSDLSMGLEIIAGRTEALNRFLQAYARLAKLPSPSRKPVSLRTLIERVVRLESRLTINIATEGDVIVQVDPDQLDQALINVTRNSVDAVLMKQSLEKPPDAVTISWKVDDSAILILVRDRGTGVLDSSNLFVPFYTTKANGTGLGLVLTRQIIEAHGGRLLIQNRPSGGVEVEIKIPACVHSNFIRLSVTGQDRP